MSANELPPGMRLQIRRVLQVGVTLSVLLLLVGIGLLLASGADPIHAAAARPSWSSILPTPWPGNGEGFLLAGVVVLILTPVARVVMSLAAFARADDLPFVLMTLFVIIMLSIAIALGIVP